MEKSSIKSNINQTTQKLNSSDGQIETNNSDKAKKHFFGRGVAAALMVIPQIVMNVGLGALKGLEVGTFKPGEFMNRQAKRIGTKDGKLSNFCGHLGTFVGVIVGIAVAVPSLLIGVVGGLIRGVYKTPEAVKACFNDGCFEAVKRTTHHYKLDARKIVIIVATALVIGATALLATPIVLISIMTIEAAAIVAPSPFLIAGGALLGYSVGGLTYAAAGTMDDVRKESN